MSESATTDTPAWALESFERDLIAVLDAAGATSVALFARQLLTPGAIAFAVTHPERVSCLALLHGFRSVRAFTEDSAVDAARAVGQADPAVYLQMIGPLVLGTGAREALESELSTGLSRLDADADKGGATTLLEQVPCPTLVLHRREQKYGGSLSLSRQLAARVPGARLATLEGDASCPMGEVSRSC